MLSRIFRGENEHVAVKRKRQIDTLKIFNDNVLELREDVEYQVQFDAGDKRMAIMVSLSPEFPLEKPVLRVSPPIIHPWCNEHSEIVSAPGLLNFTVHSDLGRVVQAIIREFSKNPPRLLEDKPLVSNIQHRDLPGRASPSYILQSYPDLPSTSYNTYYNSHFSQFSATNTNARAYNYNYTNSDNMYISDIHTKQMAIVPQHTTQYNTESQNNVLVLNNSSVAQYSSSLCTNTYPNLHYANANFIQVAKNPSQSLENGDLLLMFPELNKLSLDELKKLNESDDRLDEYVANHPEIKDTDSAVEEAIDWIEKTAMSNLAKEEELKKLKEEIADKVENVRALKARYDQLIQQYSKLSEVFTPDHIKECLKRAADESHEKSEKIAEDFLSRKIDVECFLSTYIECRKLSQVRRTKEEKLAHQLNELKRAGY